MTTYEEALARVLQTVSPAPPENVPLGSALGRVLAEPVNAPLDLPPFANSAVDGYAFRLADGRRLPLAGEVAAGDPPSELPSGAATRIFTGAPIPAGADAVAMQEDVSRTGDEIEIAPWAEVGHIRLQGEEVRAGDPIFAGGTLVTPPVVGALATLGIAEIPVHRMPKVSVVGTGSELASPGEPLAPGQVYESNTYGVSAALRAMGLSEVSHRRVRDEAVQIREAFAQALEQSDVLVVCGGVSVGDHDLVRPVLRELGVEEVLWRVKIKPGKPFLCAVGPRGQLVFGLPGNPVSALVTFTLFVRPAIQAMVGAPLDTWAELPLLHELPAGHGRDEFFRARVSAGGVQSLEAQGSGMITGLAHADVLVRIQAGTEAKRAGDSVPVLPLRWTLG
jgi:molybdopterin molybdotransferase